MTVQELRLAVAELIDSLTDETWAVTTETEPDRHHKLIEVRHPESIRQDTFGTYEATLPIEVWVSETEDVNTVGDMYALITPGPGSLQESFATSQSPVFTGFEATDCGPRLLGSNTFLACTMRVTVQAAIVRPEV